MVYQGGEEKYVSDAVSLMVEQQNMTTSNPRRQFDTTSKVVVHANLKDWAEFGLDTSNVVVIGALETEQPTVKSNRADSFIHVKVDGKEVIVHLEMQTHDSRKTPDAVSHGGVRRESD